MVTLFGWVELVVLLFISLWLVYCLLLFVCSSSWCHWCVSSWTSSLLFYTLLKHVYSNILKNLQPKKEKNQIKNYDIFHILAHKIDCGDLLEPPRRVGSNKYRQSMFLAK